MFSAIRNITLIEYDFIDGMTDEFVEKKEKQLEEHRAKKMTMRQKLVAKVCGYLYFQLQLAEYCTNVLQCQRAIL